MLFRSAKIDTLLHKAPQIENYVKAIVAGFHFNANHKQVGRIEYPFNRFYVEESKASKAEGLYTNSQMDTSQVAYALVRVKMGKAILQDVRINERSIVDLVEEINRQKANTNK